MRSYAELIAAQRTADSPAAAAHVPVMHERGKRRKSRKRAMLAKKRPRDSKGHFLKAGRRKARRARATAAAPRAKRRVRRASPRRVKRARARAHVAAAPKMKRLRKRSRKNKETGTMPRRNRKGRFTKRGTSRRRRRAREATPVAAAPRRRRRRVSRRRHARRNPTVRAAAPRRRRRSYARRARRSYRRSREKLPGGRIRVKRHTVHNRKKRVRTHGYTKRQKSRRYRRGPYTYRPSREELAAMNPIFAMENPLSMGEVVATVGFGVVGYGIGSFVDRYLATSPVTAIPAGQGAAAGFSEAPVAGKLYNTEAVTAPMGILRWAVGLGVPVVLVVGAGYIGGPWVKVGLQGVGLGWGIRTLGKGMDDLMAYLLGKGATGARLYGDEIRAMNAKAALAAQITANAAYVLPTVTTTTAGDPNAPVQMLAGVSAFMRTRGVGRATGCGRCGGGCGGNCSQQPSVPAAGPTPAQQAADAAAAAAAQQQAAANAAAAVQQVPPALAATPAFFGTGSARRTGPVAVSLEARFGNVAA